MAGDQVLVGGRSAAIGHAGEIDAGGELEHLGRQMMRRAKSGGRIGVGAGLRLREIDQFLHAAAPGHPRMHHQHGRSRSEPHDRSKVPAPDRNGSFGSRWGSTDCVPWNPR